MTKIVLSEKERKELARFLDTYRPADLINTYLSFIERKYQLRPVLFPREKTIYQSAEEVVRHLEGGRKLWHETEIKISFGQASVNEQTKKIYICPFTGKVFGDNTHPNPQDAIYDWVSKCAENTERVGGLRAKRFFVSDDPDVIKGYVEKVPPRREALKKVVYSSVLSGKLYNTKEAVISDFKKNYLKPLSLFEVQNQNKFKIEEHFLKFIREHLGGDKVAAFVEALAEFDEFIPDVERWVETEE